jgi:hypothetical protein
MFQPYFIASLMTFALMARHYSVPLLAVKKVTYKSPDATHYQNFVFMIFASRLTGVGVHNLFSRLFRELVKSPLLFPFALPRACIIHTSV